MAAIFRKSLRLTHEARKNFPSGRITNMITTDANGLQVFTQCIYVRDCFKLIEVLTLIFTSVKVGLVYIIFREVISYVVFSFSFVHCDSQEKYFSN